MWTYDSVHAEHVAIQDVTFVTVFFTVHHFALVSLSFAQSCPNDLLYSCSWDVQHNKFLFLVRRRMISNCMEKRQIIGKSFQCQMIFPLNMVGEILEF